MISSINQPVGLAFILDDFLKKVLLFFISGWNIIIRVRSSMDFFISITKVLVLPDILNFVLLKWHLEC